MPKIIAILSAKSFAKEFAPYLPKTLSVIEADWGAPIITMAAWSWFRPKTAIARFDDNHKITIFDQNWKEDIEDAATNFELRRKLDKNPVEIFLEVYV